MSTTTITFHSSQRYIASKHPRDAPDLHNNFSNHDAFPQPHLLISFANSSICFLAASGRCSYRVSGVISCDAAAVAVAVAAAGAPNTDVVPAPVAAPNPKPDVAGAGATAVVPSAVPKAEGAGAGAGAPNPKAEVGAAAAGAAAGCAAPKKEVVPAAAGAGAAGAGAGAPKLVVEVETRMFQSLNESNKGGRNQKKNN